MTYRSTKTYGHDIGMSAAFRQWRAESHCNKIHGYAMAFQFTFEAKTLDKRNWVVDFGSLKSLKGILENTFDHKLIVAEDDPEIELFKAMQLNQLCDLVILPKVGCEAFAMYVYEVADGWLIDNGYKPRVNLVSVEVMEHGANSAIYLG